MSVKERILKQVQVIPAMTGASGKVSTLLSDPESNIQEILDAVKYDPGLTANILRLANSAYFGFPQGIGSVRGALVRLGNQVLYQLVVASSVYGMMSKPLEGYELESGALWKHSLAVAVTAEKLDAVRQAGSDHTFTAGLLCDIGKIVMSTFVEEDYAEINGRCDTEHISFEVAEKLVLGINHAEVGGALIEQWNFPEDITAAVRWHHDPEQATEKYRELTDTIHIADALCIMQGLGTGRDGLRYQPSVESLQRLDLTTNKLELVISQAISGINELQSILESVRQ